MQTGAPDAVVPQPVVAAQVQWPLADLVVRADTCSGVTLIAGPGPRAKAPKGSGITWLYGLRPEDVRAWADTVERLVDAPAPAAGDTSAYTPAPLLQEARGGGFLVVARAWHQRPEAAAVVVLSDSASRMRWRVDVGRIEIVNLLQALRAMAAVSHYAPPAAGAGTGDTVYVSAAALDTPARVEHIPAPIYPAQQRRRGEPGRVWTEFIIGTDGRVEPASVRVLYATHPDFAAAALHVLPGARFHPGRTRGVAVRQLVFLPFTFGLAGR